MIITSKVAKKTQNLRNRPTIYFSIDDANPPYKGVKGKGNATIVEDPNRIVPQAEKISIKYLGTLDHPEQKRWQTVQRMEKAYLWKLVRSSFPHGILVKVSDNESNFNNTTIIFTSRA